MCQEHEEQEIKIKKCSKCKEEKPATKEYFHTHKGCKDGLNSVCKSCRSIIAAKRIRKSDNVPEGYKQCVDCREILQINDDNFNPYVTSLDGYYNVCIKCQIARRRNGAEEGFKKCVLCNNIYPSNRDYYQPDNKCFDGFRNMCWECIGQNFFPDFAEESWIENDIKIVENNYKDVLIKDIIPLLSVQRTEKAIMHMAQKLGIRKIESYVNNYNNLKYKIIDNVLHKYCKSCGRYLPFGYDYFPKDDSCIDNYRNVCRECKGEQFRVNSNVH